MEDSRLVNTPPSATKTEQAAKPSHGEQYQASSETIDTSITTPVMMPDSTHASHNITPQAQWQGFDQIPLQSIDERYYTQVLYESLFMAVIIFIAASVGVILLGALSLAFVLLSLTTLILVFTAIGYLRYLQAKQLSYAVCEHEFVMEQGLWWHKRTSLPYSRLQHVSLSQGPLERHFNLFTLKCFSAGSGSAEIELPGIEQQTAEHLRQHLLTQAAKAHSPLAAEQSLDTHLDAPIMTQMEPTTEAKDDE